VLEVPDPGYPKPWDAILGGRREKQPKPWDAVIGKKIENKENKAQMGL